MGAPKLNHNLSLKKDNKSGGVEDSAKLKREIEAYREKISQMLKDKENVKKAVLIIERMLHNKN